MSKPKEHRIAVDLNTLTRVKRMALDWYTQKGKRVSQCEVIEEAMTLLEQAEYEKMIGVKSKGGE